MCYTNSDLLIRHALRRATSTFCLQNSTVAYKATRFPAGEGLGIPWIRGMVRVRRGDSRIARMGRAVFPRSFGEMRRRRMDSSDFCASTPCLSPAQNDK